LSGAHGPRVKVDPSSISPGSEGTSTPGPLRYRLLDIDRLISRTLVYGLLTAVLAGVYVTGVFVSRRLLDPTTGDSALAVAASTLAVAGCSSRCGGASSAWSTPLQPIPLRRGQDRGGLQRPATGGIDLDSLSAELLVVIDQTMQPTQASLWLQPRGSRPPLVQ
jgi:hypothetical protein